MSAVSETIVREYFELHDFFVHQQRKYITTARREDEEIDFFVFNPRYQAGSKPLPFELQSENLKHVARAMVVVKGWHTESISASLLAATPEILRFLEPAAMKQAEQAFPGAGPLVKLLVVPGLPATEELRRQTVELLKAKGLDGVISFRAMLADLIDHVEVNRNYQKSDLLQILRILKNYEFFREPQLELFHARKRRFRRSAPA